MTKSPSKFVLRKQTLRLLSNKDLSLAVGGFDPDAVLADSGATGCPLAPLAR
jgi:hypothetical protein